MNYELIPGKVALVTGGTRGLGRAIARWMALGGADIFLHDEDASQAGKYGEASGPEQVVGEIEGLGRQCDLGFGDLRFREAADAAARSALERFGRIDVLVNCAGGDIGASGGKPAPNECVEIP